MRELRAALEEVAGMLADGLISETEAAALKREALQPSVKRRGSQDVLVLGRVGHAPRGEIF